MNKMRLLKASMYLVWLVCLFLILMTAFPLSAQTEIDIEGIDGLSFTKKAASYVETVPDTFYLHMMKIVPEDLSVKWDADTASFCLFGDAKILFSEEEFFVSLGTEDEPGLFIQNDVLDKVNFGFTASFGLKGITVLPDSLSFMWDKAEDNYDIYGALQVDIEGDTLIASLGSPDDPGLEIKDGSIDHIHIGVTDDFEIKSLRIAPDDLTFMWDKIEDDYDIYGSIKVDIEGDSIVAVLGDADNPGIEIKNGSVDKINIGITEDFELKALTIKTDSLGLSWQKEQTGDVYHLFGSVDIDIENDKIGFSFGNMSDPGLVYENGLITSLKIATSEDLHFGGLEVGSENLTLEYHQDIYHLSGKMFVQDMWHAEIDLGSGPGSGVTLDLADKPAKIKIDKAAFDLGDVDLGALTIKDLKLSMADNTIQESDLIVEFPPGWEVGADLTFAESSGSFEIASMDIDWEALTFEEAIEMPGTGAFITKIEGGVFNLDDPHNFYFDGHIGMTFGGPFKIGDEDVSIVYMETEAKITRSELLITSDVKLGAYMDSHGTWHSVLGDGNLEIDLKWDQYYSLAGHLNIPSNPFIKTDLEAKLSTTGGFNALIDVHLLVPHFVPLIGGHEFGEADGAIHYDKKDPSSFAAGWVSIDLLFDTVKKGVKYNFKTKDISIIGSKAINNLKRTSSQPVSSPKPATHYLQSIYVTIDESRPHFLQMKVKLDQAMSFHLRAQLPGGGQIPSFCPIYLVNGVDEMTQSSVDYNMLKTFLAFYIPNKDEIVFYLMPPGYDTDTKARLAAGEYRIDLLGPFTSDDQITAYESHKMFDHPKIDYQAFSTFYETRPADSGDTLGGIVLDLKRQWDVRTSVYDPDSAKIKFLYSKDGQKGVLAETKLYKDCLGSWDNNDPMARNVSSVIDELNPGDDLYLWATINDGINAPVQTDVEKMDYNFPIQGHINIANEPDSVASAIRVNILVQGSDSKWHPINGDDGKRTNFLGEFGFTQKCISGSSLKLEVDIPYGYSVDPSTIYPPEVIYPVDDNGGYDFGTIILKKN